MMRRIPRSELTIAPVPISYGPEAGPLAGALTDHATHARALARAEHDIVDITQRAVAALVQAELTLSPEHIRNVVQQLLQEVRTARQLSVHVHPLDRALLPSPEQLAQRAEAEGVIQLVDDPSLSRGDCVITSEWGEIDGRIATKLAQLKILLERHTST